MDSERTAPDLRDSSVRLRLAAGEVVSLEACVTQYIDAGDHGFEDVGTRIGTPTRHRFTVSVGDDLGAQLGLDEAGINPGKDPAAAAQYLDGVAAALEGLAAEAAPMAPDTSDLDPFFGVSNNPAGGAVVAYLAIDEFRRRDVQRPRTGEEWFWLLDANEVPQYTTMEALVRDVVDLWIIRGITPMRHGSLWWVRTLHVHPRCRGQQLGGRLLGYALGELRRGPVDLAVLEAHPEPTQFGPRDQAQPGWTNWDTYEPPSLVGVEGLVRYFARMGFRRADDLSTGVPQFRPVLEEHDLSRTMGVHERGPRTREAAVAMFAFLGDLQFLNGPPLGRSVQSAPRA